MVVSSSPHISLRPRRVPGLDLDEERSLGFVAEDRTLLDYSKPPTLTAASQTFCLLLLSGKKERKEHT